jgi:hypothetical protein
MRKWTLRLGAGGANEFAEFFSHLTQTGEAAFLGAG